MQDNFSSFTAFYPQKVQDWFFFLLLAFIELLVFLVYPLLNYLFSSSAFYLHEAEAVNYLLPSPSILWYLLWFIVIPLYHISTFIYFLHVVLTSLYLICFVGSRGRIFNDVLNWFSLCVKCPVQVFFPQILIRLNFFLNSLNQVNNGDSVIPFKSFYSSPTIEIFFFFFIILLW